MINDISNFLNGETWESNIVSKLFKIGLILIIGFLIIKVLTKYVYRYLDEKDSQQCNTIKTVVGSLIKYVTYFFMITTILGLLEITSLASITVAVAGVGSVAIGFGAQTFVKDVITGAFILMEEQFQVDDVVNIEGFMGKVEAIGLRTTTLRNVMNNEVYIIPNGEIKIVTNKTKDFQKVSISFRLKYQDDLESIRVLVRNSLKDYEKDDRILAPLVVNVNADSLEPVINVNVNCPVKNNQAYSVRNDLTNDLTKLFYDHDLEIALPLHLLNVKQ